jgi:DNA polymerase
MKTLSIDIETYSDIPLQKTGVYRYCESPNFEILLFGYSIDSGPVQVVDLACGEHIPKEVLAALEDDSVIKWAFNAPSSGYASPGISVIPPAVLIS